MVKSCAAFNCHNRWTGDTSASFHQFPADENLKGQWVRAMQKKNFKPGKHSVICAKHFKEADFLRLFPKKVLKSGAVPSIFDFSVHLKVKSRKRGKTINRHLPARCKEKSTKMMENLISHECLKESQEEYNRTVHTEQEVDFKCLCKLEINDTEVEALNEIKGEDILIEDVKQEINEICYNNMNTFATECEIDDDNCLEKVTIKKEVSIQQEDVNKPVSNFTELDESNTSFKTFDDLKSNVVTDKMSDLKNANFSDIMLYNVNKVDSECDLGDDTWLKKTVVKKEITSDEDIKESLSYLTDANQGNTSVVDLHDGRGDHLNLVTDELFNSENANFSEATLCNMKVDPRDLADDNWLKNMTVKNEITADEDVEETGSHFVDLGEGNASFKGLVDCENTSSNVVTVVVSDLKKPLDATYQTEPKGNLKSKKLRHGEHVEIFKCSTCNYETVYNNYMVRHIRRHCVQNCTKCTYQTKNKSSLRTHHISKHDENATIFKCPDCAYETKFKSKLTDHKQRMHREDKETAKCTLCPFQTKDKRDLEQHNKLKHDKSAEVFERTGCAEHKRLTHDKNALIFKCETCAYETKDKSYLEQHNKLKHDKNAQVLKCKECGYETLNKFNLAIHKKLKHDTNAVVFKCRRTYEAKRKPSLVEHNRLKHDENAVK